MGFEQKIDLKLVVIKRSKMFENIKKYTLLIAVIVIISLLLLILYIITYYPKILNPYIDAFYVIIGSLISGFVTIIWNETLFRRNKRVEEERRLNESETIKQQAQDEILSILSAIKEATDENISLLREKEDIFELHLLSTGFWELSISNIPLYHRKL